MDNTILTPEDISKVKSVAKDVDVTRKIGESSLGSVYEITHPTHEKCALKIFQGRSTQNKNFLRRFLQQVANASDIDHRNICKIYSVGEGEHFFIIRELTPGESLDAKLGKDENKKGLSLREATEIILHLANGLETIHDKGLVHKNLKPSNVIVNEKNEVKTVDYSLPPTTPHYLSPEQCKGKKSNFLSDVYALGAIYFYTLTGVPAQDGNSPKEIMESHIHNESPNVKKYRNDLPLAIVELLAKMLKKEPSERPQSCREIIQVLDQIIKTASQETQAVEGSDLPSQNDFSFGDGGSAPAIASVKVDFSITEETPESSSLEFSGAPMEITFGGVEEEEASVGLAISPSEEDTEPSTLLETTPLEEATHKTQAEETVEATVIPETAVQAEEVAQEIQAEEAEDAGLSLNFDSVEIGEQEGEASIDPVAVMEDVDEELFSSFEISGDFEIISNTPQELQEEAQLELEPEPEPEQEPEVQPIFINLGEGEVGGVQTPADGLNETGGTADVGMYTDTSTISLVPAEDPALKQRRMEKFKQVSADMASKLKIVNQTLSMIDNVQELESILFLDEILSFIAAKTGELLRSDRTVIFIYDEEKNELMPILDKDDDSLPDRMPADVGILGEVISTKKVVNIPYDFYDDPRCEGRKAIDEKTNYRTYTMMCLPLLNAKKDPIAVVQLLNKLKNFNDSKDQLSERIDKVGFTSEDLAFFEEFGPSMRLILESSQSFFRATQKQRAAASLMSAIQTLSQTSLDLGETLNNVMDEAKQLLDADRITLWLLDKEADELWANIEVADGTLKEIRIPRNIGFAGQVVETGEPILIPFDLYDHPDSETAKKTDQMTGYRTCSMLCMPVVNADGEMIGVTQLINKRRKGDFKSYDAKDWPTPPDLWKASFDRSDLAFMESFNIQAGVAIQNATLFATVREQEQMQRNILRSLSNGVISTDKDGKVIAANESATTLLGLAEDDKIEGLPIKELVKIKGGNFLSWLETALGSVDEKSAEQYYPEQTLLSCDDQEHSVNLSINSIKDVRDQSVSNGALVVIDDISDEKRVKGMMYRYMTQEVVEQLLTSGDMQLGGQRKEVTVLFSDIRSYTTLTEGAEAEEVVAMLNEYFEEMVDALFKYKGTLDKYIGDALMAVFGTPLPLDDHPWCAVQTAVEMRHRLAVFNEKRAAIGKKTITIGIGVHTDEVVSGNIGSSKRMELTSIGDGVNLASRLEGASKQYGCDIVISGKTLQSCAEKIYVRELDFIIVKGKTKPVKIYDLVGLRSEPISDEKKKIIEHYGKGRDLYQKCQFVEAMAEFEEVLKVDSKNVAAKLHIDRCQHLQENHPGDNWDGVWTLTEK